MRVFLVCVLSILSLPAVTDCCSCPIGVPRTRSYSLQSGVCSGDVFVARVTGATCNCLPSEGEESVIYCYDYQLESGEINVELVDRGQCYGQAQPHYVVSIGAIHTCLSLAETREAGLVNGYTVERPTNTTLLPLRNLTDSSGRCDFPCLLNDTQYPNYYLDQACFYAVEITEVIKGNYTANQRLMVGGPDTTICGNPTALLTINERYVVGVGSICGAISPWSTLQSYSPNELEMLRAFGRDFQAGSLTCGALTFVSSLPLILSSMALVAMANLFY